jgi:HEAT repeat protein
MRYCLLLICFLLLTGCDNDSTPDLQSQRDATIEMAKKRVAEKRVAALIEALANAKLKPYRPELVLPPIPLELYPDEKRQDAIKDKRVRDQAAAKQASAQAAASLAAAERAVVERAVFGLGVAAVPALVEALKHNNRDVRLAVVSSLGTIGSEARPALKATSENDPDTTVREAAAAALKKIKP